MNLTTDATGQAGGLCDSGIACPLSVTRNHRTVAYVHGQPPVGHHKRVFADWPGNILSTPKCSSGTSQSRRHPARPVKIMASAGYLPNSAAPGGQHARQKESRPRTRADRAFTFPRPASDHGAHLNLHPAFRAVTRPGDPNFHVSVLIETAPVINRGETPRQMCGEARGSTRTDTSLLVGRTPAAWNTLSAWRKLQTTGGLRGCRGWRCRFSVHQPCRRIPCRAHQSPQWLGAPEHNCKVRLASGPSGSFHTQHTKYQ